MRCWRSTRSTLLVPKEPELYSIFQNAASESLPSIRTPKALTNTASSVKRAARRSATESPPRPLPVESKAARSCATLRAAALSAIHDCRLRADKRWHHHDNENDQAGAHTALPHSRVPHDTTPALRRQYDALRTVGPGFVQQHFRVREMRRDDRRGRDRCTDPGQQRVRAVDAASRCWRGAERDEGVDREDSERDTDGAKRGQPGEPANGEGRCGTGHETGASRGRRGSRRWR